MNVIQFIAWNSSRDRFAAVRVRTQNRLLWTQNIKTVMISGDVFVDFPMFICFHKLEVRVVENVSLILWALKALIGDIAQDLRYLANLESYATSLFLLYSSRYFWCVSPPLKAVRKGINLRW